MIIREKSILAIIIALLFHIQVFAADWPQWRGVNRDAIWHEKGIVQKFEPPKDRWSNIHMVRHEDKIWMFNERGELIISRLSPEGFHQISRTKLIETTTGQLNHRPEGVCWSHPAFANKHIYIRNDQELVCADLSMKK